MPYADYAKRAAGAVGEGARIVNLRLPAGRGMPVVAFVRARGDSGAACAASTSIRRPGACSMRPCGGGLIGWAHDFHESLTLREYNGREIVGVVGIAMLVSSLSGIYLWWPRRRLASPQDFTFRRGSRCRATCTTPSASTVRSCSRCCRSPASCWRFPRRDARRSALFATVSPSPRGVQAIESVGPADHAGRSRRRRAARNSGSATVASVGFPAGPRGVYRIALREPGDDSERGTAVVFVDPRSAHGAAASRSVDANAAAMPFSPFSGRCTKAMRWVSPGAS